jgi:hypothetical protein
MTTTATRPDIAAGERERRRGIFHDALGKYRAIEQGSPVKAQNPAHLIVVGGSVDHFNPVLWQRDFLLAAMNVLHGQEVTIFYHYYHRRQSREFTMNAIGKHSADSFGERIAIIQEKVGGELERRRIWPMQAYMDRSQEIMQIFESEAGRKFGRSHRKHDLDGN